LLSIRDGLAGAVRQVQEAARKVTLSSIAASNAADGSADGRNAPPAVKFWNDTDV